jgi:polysaccharide biosynthesis/export protein
MQLASIVFPIRPVTLRRLTASSLMLLHSSAIVLTTAVVYQVAGQPVQAQTATPLPPLAGPATGFDAAPKRPTALELVEAARQRLRDRGELPPANAPTPAKGTAPSLLPIGTTPLPPMPPLGPGPDPLFTTPQPFAAYRLGPGDAVTIVVQRFADFNVQSVISPEGNITHPILGKITLQGMTVDQAQEVVRRSVDRFIINPVVLVALSSQRPVQVTITGEVSRPGLYPLSQSPKVSSVLLAAGGTREGADLRAVKLRRPQPDGTIAEENLDFFTPLKEGTGLPDPRLQDGDTIVIAKLPADAKDYDRKVVATSTLVKPKITVRVLSYARGGLTQVVLDNGSTFLDALAVSSLNPDNVDMKRIALVRFDEQQKKAVSLEIDGKRVIMGDMTQNVALQDNDVIVIGRNLVGRITYALNVFTQPFRDVLGFLLFFKQLSNSASDLFGPTRR